MSQTRPSPLVDKDSEPFWDALREHRFLLRACLDCGHLFFPPRLVCPECWSANLGWKGVGGRGVVYSYTVVEAGATSIFADQTPYTLVLVTLEEGCRVFGMLRDNGSPAVPSIGAPVECRYEDDPETGFTFPVFVLAGEPTPGVPGGERS